MITLRRTLAVGLGVLGAYYAVIGAITLANLPSATHRWIELSRDQDFRFDFPIWFVLIGAGSGLVALLGLVTAVRAVRMARGEDVRWGALAVVAPVIHFPWFVYRAIATGAPVFPAFQTSPALRVFAMRCGLICAAYALAWVVTRVSVARPSSGEFVQ